MAKLKPWYQVVTPREDLRKNRSLEASEFAVNLGHIHDQRAEVPEVYSDPVQFFSRTLITGSLRELGTQVIRRLNGLTQETSAVFNMATNFGGGKTHSLTALYHIGKGGSKAAAWDGIRALMTAGEVKDIPEAAVAVFNGKDFDSLTGRGNPGEPIRKTPWGDIAWQLGGQKSLDILAEHEKEFIEPKGDAIRAMLPKDRPVLILFDEVISYVSTYRGRGYGNKLYNFLDCFAEVARGEKNVVIVVSIPASELEYTTEDHADESRFQKMLDRLGKAIVMSADQEMADIIRRRLFEWDGLNDEARKTIKAYADWSVEHSNELVGIDHGSAYDLFKSTYPFHPAVLRLFEGKWQSIETFQRTRGALRLLAQWVAHNCQPENYAFSEEPLITLGLAPFDNQWFRSALFAQMGNDRLNVPILTDIWRRDGTTHSGQLDKEASTAIKKAQLHRKVASTIFFESTGGMSKQKAEATLSEIRTNVCGPDVHTADVETALEGLSGTCFYLQWEQNRYRFGIEPNLNQVLVSRRGDVKDPAIEERIRERTKKIFGKDSSADSKQIKREYFPTKTSDVPEVPKLTLVVMDIDQVAKDKATIQFIESIIRENGSSSRTLKSALIFAAPDPAENVFEKTREALAWEAIKEDDDTTKRIDEAQLKMLDRSLKEAYRQLDEAIFRAYRHLYLLGKENNLVPIDLGNITSSSGGSIVEIYLTRLGVEDGKDVLSTSVPGRKLPGFWPSSLVEWSTKAVRDAFYSSPLLPRLINPDAIRRAIVDGISGEFIDYAVKDSSGQLRLRKPNDSLFDDNIEISDDVFILKEEDAKKLREPPALKELRLNRSSVSLQSGDQATFKVEGIDQYGQYIDAGTLEWKSTGGTITDDGLYLAGTGTGQFEITVKSANAIAVAEVRIQKEGPTAPPPPAGKKTIRWSGTVPPQKWMNFYTKVLTKLVSNPDLTLKVSFEAPLEHDQAESKAEETRSGLKELGFEGDVSVS
jgi:predicted AAA+ superfamily ATPase